MKKAVILILIAGALIGGILGFAVVNRFDPAAATTDSPPTKAINAES